MKRLVWAILKALAKLTSFLIVMRKIIKRILRIFNKSKENKSC